MRTTGRWVDRSIHAAGAVVLLGLVSLPWGCASASPPQRGPAVFFPEPPAPPRVQFLTSFNGLKDVEKQSGFDRFVVGETPDVRLDKPYGVAIHAGRIYVCDTNSTVVVFDLRARRFEAMRAALEGPGKLLQPTNISIDAQGFKYVTDPVRGQVVVFDADDHYLRSFGLSREWRPVDAVPFGDRLYVADYANGVVEVFDMATGEVVRTIGDRGAPEERLGRPTNLAFDPDGDLYVTDFYRIQILKFDRDGHFKAALGRAGDNPGTFARPKGLAVDREGRLFAVDAAFGNVQVFDRDGNLLMYFGKGGQQPGDLVLPAEVTVDYDDVDLFRDEADPNFEVESLILVTSQFGPRMVNVYAFGRDRRRSYLTDEELRRQIEERRPVAGQEPPGQ